jgi:hypothetical protein
LQGLGRDLPFVRRRHRRAADCAPRASIEGAPSSRGSGILGFDACLQFRDRDRVRHGEYGIQSHTRDDVPICVAHLTVGKTSLNAQARSRPLVPWVT